MIIMPLLQVSPLKMLGSEDRRYISFQVDTTNVTGLGDTDVSTLLKVFLAEYRGFAKSKTGIKTP